MTPLRKEDLTLFCEDRDGGRSSVLIEAALQSLVRADSSLGFATSVRPRGGSSKSDVQVWTKFARSQGFRAFGVRDRDFLLRGLCREARASAFHASDKQVKPWPLQRHCIESYLLEEDVVHAVLPALDVETIRSLVAACAQDRFWLDVARGAVEDFLWRLRNADRESIEGRPTDRESALLASRTIAARIRASAGEESADAKLDSQFDAIAEDMASDGSLPCRVDGRELIGDVSRALTKKPNVELPQDGLLRALTKQAEKQPPAALLADVRELLLAIPAPWR